MNPKFCLMTPNAPSACIALCIFISIPASLPDLAFGVINANYALGAGLTTDDAVAYEAADSEAAETYVNVIVVNAGNENSEKTQALIAAIQTDAVKEFILNTYNGAVQPKF